MSVESVMPFNHLILCHPLLLLPSIFPSIRVFSKESALGITRSKYWSSAQALVLAINIQDWFPTIDWLDLLAVQGTLQVILDARWKNEWLNPWRPCLLWWLITVGRMGSPQDPWPTSIRLSLSRLPSDWWSWSCAIRLCLQEGICARRISWSCLYVETIKQYKWTYLYNINRLTDIKDKSMFTRGEMEERSLGLLITYTHY